MASIWLDLCKLVLGYNSLKGFGMHNEREAIRKEDQRRALTST